MDVIAPAHWACIDFISDLHLQQTDQATYGAWQRYLRTTQADALFILGDLFEVWVGDDVLHDATRFEAQCAADLHSASQRLPVYVMQGNRDFLMGPALMQACAATLLPDPSVLEFGGMRWLLSHGDAWCLEDRDYQQFRALVRSASWQQTFLAQPLAERQRVARDIRNQSEAHKRADHTLYADVDAASALAALASSEARHLIHGHTHRPARHDLGGGQQRWVLSDWDLSALLPRAQVLRLRRQTNPTGTPRVTMERIPPALA